MKVELWPSPIIWGEGLCQSNRPVLIHISDNIEISEGGATYSLRGNADFVEYLRGQVQGFTDTPDKVRTSVDYDSITFAVIDDELFEKLDSRFDQLVYAAVVRFVEFMKEEVRKAGNDQSGPSG